MMRIVAAAETMRDMAFAQTPISHAIAHISEIICGTNGLRFNLLCVSAHAKLFHRASASLGGRG
jgi:hypothetical protein